MKNFTKSVVVLLMCSILFCSLGIVAFATEVEEFDGNCAYTITLEDKTGGIFIDEITVTFMDLATNESYVAVMTSLDYLFGNSVSGTVPYGTYNVAVSYASKGTVIVQDSSGSSISSFTANTSDYAFNWEAIIGEEVSDIETTVSTSNNYVADTGDAEIDKLWNDYIEAIASIETDSQYASVLKIVGNTASYNSSLYEQVTGNSADEYLEMTSYEQFLWYSTFIAPVLGITSSDYDTYCGSLASWEAKTLATPIAWLTLANSDEMMDAYLALMEWDYNYFVSNGAVYNFIDGTTSLENSSLVVVEEKEETNNELGLTDKEIEEIIEEVETEEQEELVVEEEQGIWDNTVSLMKTMSVTLVILLILVGALIGVIIYRKRKAIDDEKE